MAEANQLKRIIRIFVVTRFLPNTRVHSNSTVADAAIATGWPENVRDFRLQREIKESPPSAANAKEFRTQVRPPPQSLQAIAIHKFARSDEAE